MSHQVMHISFAGATAFIFWGVLSAGYPSGPPMHGSPGLREIPDRISGAGVDVRAKGREALTNTKVYEVRAWNSHYEPLTLDSAVITVEEVRGVNYFTVGWWRLQQGMRGADESGGCDRGDVPGAPLFA